MDGSNVCLMQHSENMSNYTSISETLECLQPAVKHHWRSDQFYSTKSDTSSRPQPGLFAQLTAISARLKTFHK